MAPKRKDKNKTTKRKATTGQNNHPTRKTTIPRSTRRKNKRINNVAGYNHRIFRIRNEDGEWESWESWITKHGRNRRGDTKIPRKYVDSIVHRFNRVIGFSHGDEEEYEDDENLLEFREQMLQIPSLPKSEENRVLCQALFENWVLSTAKRTIPYKRFLKEISDPKPENQKIVRYMPPTDALLNGYILYMSNKKSKIL